MKFLLMPYEDEHHFAARTTQADSAAYWAAWTAFGQALGQAGVLVNGNALQPPTLTTTVRLQQGKRVIHDGPYADTKEQLGGYFLLELPDLDAALAWAERCPAAAYGAVEIRPVLTM